MNKSKRRFTIGYKMYLFISFIVLTAVIGTATISYSISAEQIDRFYKSTTLSTAENLASMLDSEFLAALREEFSTDGYQQVLSQAESEENDDLIRDYLETAGLWEGYAQTSNFLNRYLDSNETVKYLYMIVCGDAYAEYSLYLMDDDESPLYLVPVL